MDRIMVQDCLGIINQIDLSPLHNKTVCITGANGMIGTYLIYVFHLANVHKDAGIHIVAISRHPPCHRLRDIFINRYAFYSMDLSQASAYDFRFRADYYIHGATYAQPGKFLNKALETIHLNTTTVEELLIKARKDGARLLYLSSSEVYGDPDKESIPTPETYPGLVSALGVRAVYSESKRMGETLCFAYRHYRRADVKIARIAMTYGPGVDMRKDERVLAHFIRQALETGNIRLLDDGKKVRTFCYISDCVGMLLNILLYGKDFVYNVTGTDRITIRELAEEVGLITGSTVNVNTLSKPDMEKAINRERPHADSPVDQTRVTGDGPAVPTADIKSSPAHVELDGQKVRNEFNLPPFVPLRAGLERTIQWNITTSPV